MKSLENILEEVSQVFKQAEKDLEPSLKFKESGTVISVQEGIAVVKGLPGVQSEELIRFPGGLLGLAFNLDPGQVGVILLDENQSLQAGDEARRTHQILSVPVGRALAGRVIDALGRPLDEKSIPGGLERMPVERPAPAIMDRAPVTTPLQTGLKVVDALIPIGRGQRELILGDRQTGKTAVAVDTMINQKDKGVFCIYCAIGQRSSSLAKVIADLEQREAMEYCTIVATTEDDPPGQRYIAPYAAMTLGEYFRDQGKDALVVFDDLTRHARAYREISLLLRRPPGREAYPGDIFYIHSRLLERSTHLRDEHGGGSLTALPIIETEAQNLSAYIPTNLISITDGQIYLNPDLFRKAILPAIDVGKSVSRVGGKTQLPAYRSVSGDLRLSYSQFQELESFARFGTRLDEETRKKLEHGKRVREILKQSQYDPLRVFEQISVLLAVSRGLFDEMPLEKVGQGEEKIRDEIRKRKTDLAEKMEDGQKIEKEELESLLEAIRQILEQSEMKEEENADTGADQ